MRLKFLLTDFFIKVSFFFTELADFFHSLPVVFLKARDLIELNNRQYSKDYVVENWQASEQTGLSSSEERFCRDYGFAGARALVIGCGPGREAIALAKSGFQVKAIDSSLPMLDACARNSEAVGVKVELVPLSLFELDKIELAFDLVFIGGNYGLIPTRQLRRKVLLMIKDILKPNAAVYLSFTAYKPSKYSGAGYLFYKILGRLCLGNTKVEKGDLILGTGEFHHCFDSAEAVIREAGSAGFLVEDMDKEENALFLKVRS
jgi:SAM-dependent methyltransferase